MWNKIYKLTLTITYTCNQSAIKHTHKHTHTHTLYRFLFLQTSISTLDSHEIRAQTERKLGVRAWKNNEEGVTSQVIREVSWDTVGWGLWWAAVFRKEKAFLPRYVRIWEIKPSIIKVIDSLTALISRQKVEDIFPVAEKGQGILWLHLSKIFIS